MTTQGLVTASSLVNPDLNFQTPGVDLLTIGSGGMNIAPNTAISFGTKPTAAGDYELMTGDISGFNAANFVLPTAPAGDTYSLQVVSGASIWSWRPCPNQEPWPSWALAFWVCWALPGGGGKPVKGWQR